MSKPCAIILTACIALAIANTDGLAQSVKSSVVQERCLISWDDSQQIHSHGGVTWQKPLGTVRMKKLRHCIKLTTVGPVDVQGVAKSYVDSCVNKALNDSKTEYIVRAIVALGADVLGGGGAASGANVAAYIDHVKSTAISCLTDTSNIQNHIKNRLADEFKADVKKTSHWIYWDV